MPLAPETLPRRLRRIALLACALPWMSASAAARVSTGIDEEAQLPYWELATDAMSLRLVQRLPDQTRGFFLARGFKPEDAERIAQSCVFQAIFQNTASDPAGPLDYDLREWAVRHDGHAQAMKTREDWKPVWEKRGVAPPARIAFEWALLPTRQRYQPGDYNWGMSIFGLAPGALFDLHVVWTQNGRKQSATLAGVQCAPDVRVGPAGEGG